MSEIKGKWEEELLALRFGCFYLIRECENKGSEILAHAVKTKRGKDPTYSDPQIIWVPSVFTDITDGFLALHTRLWQRTTSWHRSPPSTTDTSTRLNPQVWWAQEAKRTSLKGWETLPPAAQLGTLNTAQRASLVACMRKPTARTMRAQHSCSEMLCITYSTAEGCWHSLYILSFDQEKCFIVLSIVSLLLAKAHKTHNKMFDWSSG